MPMNLHIHVILSPQHRITCRGIRLIEIILQKPLALLPSFEQAFLQGATKVTNAVTCLLPAKARCEIVVFYYLFYCPLLLNNSVVVKEAVNVSLELWCT
jgi:hypothetical protein